MSQILAIGQGKYLTVTRSWADGGRPGRYGLVGGQMVMLTEGTRPHPEILMIGSAFFYKNGEPVTKLEDVEYLEEPYRSQAEAFILDGKPKQAAPIAKTQAEAAEPKRGRGRPKKAVDVQPRRIEIKDEQSLLEVAGYDQDEEN